MQIGTKQASYGMDEKVKKKRVGCSANILSSALEVPRRSQQVKSLIIDCPFQRPQGYV